MKGPFRVPSFNSYVPRRMQPWIYLTFAFIFLMSGGIYGGTMQNVMGEYSLMREDVMMIVMCNVVGVNMPFPMLFRLKFAFPNRRLLLNAALVIALCNFLIMFTDNVAIMCVLGFIAGFFKLCGCFECMSTIQLWITPKRDFTIFFPVLYCLVLGNMFLSPWVTEHLVYIFQDWRVVNWLMIGLLLTVALIVFTTTHNFMFMKPIPFISIDYMGCLLWSALMIEFIFFFNYGEHYNWLDSRVMRMDLLLFLVTLFCACNACSTYATRISRPGHGDTNASYRCSRFLHLWNSWAARPKYCRQRLRAACCTLEFSPPTFSISRNGLP